MFNSQFPPCSLIPASEAESPEIADQVRDEGIGLSPLGATGVFRGTTECGYGPTKESDSPVTKVGTEGAPTPHRGLDPRSPEIVQQIKNTHHPSPLICKTLIISEIQCFFEVMGG